MRNSFRALACLTTLLLSTLAGAEIYEQESADGTTVFTDSPTPGATEVDLPETNSADAVKPAPGNTSAPTATPQQQGEQQQTGKVVVIPNSRNAELEQEVNADRPHEVLEAEPRHEVLEAEKRYEVGDHITAEERARREAAKEGVIVDADGNVEHIQHRGHVGGHR